MKGIFFNLLEEFICENFGDAIYENILDMCPLKTKTAFIGPESYPDSDLTTIVEQATQKLGITTNDALHAFGKYCFHKLAIKYPNFVKDHQHPKTFLKTVHSIIHVEVCKLYPDANTPIIIYTDINQSQAILTYESKRQLCHLMSGLLEGTAEYFRSPMQLYQTQCMNEGATHCIFNLRYT